MSSLVIGAVAALQGLIVLLLLVFAVAEGDAWGIALGMALELATPIVALTLPAILLRRRGYPGAGAALALVSGAASCLLWRFA